MLVVSQFEVFEVYDTTAIFGMWGQKISNY